MKQILFIMLALLLVATFVGVAGRQAESTGRLQNLQAVIVATNSLKNATNNHFSDRCKEEGLNRDTILSCLHTMDSLIKVEADEWEKHPEVVEYFEALIAVCEEINKSKTYNDTVCKKFIAAYKWSDSVANDLEELLRAQEEPTSQGKQKIQGKEGAESQQAQSEATRDAFQELTALTQRYDALESDITILFPTLCVVGTLVVISFICMSVLLFKGKHTGEPCPQTKDAEEERISETYATKISVNRLDGRVKTLEHTTETLKQTIDNLTEPLGDIRRSLPSQPHLAEPTVWPEVVAEPSVARPVIPDQPPGVGIPSDPQPRPEVIYVSVNAGKSKALFKQSLIRSDEHLYEIHPESTQASNGEVHICQNIKPDFVKKFIDQRRQYLEICDVVSATITPQRIEMISPGKAFKNGNEWIVTTSPKVQLV